MIEVDNKVAFTNPFPGLRSFELADAYLFFGRDTQINDLKEKLSYSRFLAIIGSSGSGKSSLVKAGLLPQLIDNKFYAARHNQSRLVYFNPEASPIRNFARALFDSFGDNNPDFAASFSAGQIEQLLLNDPEAILDWCADTNLLVVIDQFEELFRYQLEANDRVEVTRFIDLMLDFARRPDASVYVVLTMRSDYLDECTDYEGLTEAINNGYYLLPKMNREEIRQAITTPVRIMGAAISDELTSRLLADIGDRPDQLPILQHALMRTWNYWQLTRKAGNLIELADYEAIGTMQRAVSVHAEEVYGDLPDEKSRAATEKLFKALIELSAGDTGVIHPMPLRAIADISGVEQDLLRDVLDRFREPGVAFLTPPTNVAATPELIIDIAHERIMQLWDRLRAWVQEETESAKFYKQVSTSAALYYAGKTGLWDNPELQIGLKWLAENRPTQAWAERYDPFLERAIGFLEYSRDQFNFRISSREARQKRELKRARFFAIFLGVGALVSLFFLIVSAVLRTQARQSEEEALAEKKIALFERNRAEAQTREAITQKKIAEQQDLITEQQRRLTEEQRIIAVREQRTAEAKRQEAEEARQMAVAQKQQADAARAEAEQQKTRADAARTEAVTQKQQADVARTEAEAQRTRAITAQGYAEQQRGKAIARTLAIQSQQITGGGEDDLPALLALEAANLNRKNGGAPDNPDIFNALAKATDAGTVLRGHNDLVRTVVVSGVGGRLASGSDDGTVRLWDYRQPTQPPRALVTGRKGLDGMRAVLLGNDGQSVYAGSEKGLLYVWNLSEAAPTQALKAHGSPVQALLPTPNQRRLISVAASGEVRSWQISPGRLDSVHRARSGYPIFSAQLSPDGKRLLCGVGGNRLLSFDAADLRKPPTVLTRREFGDRVTALAFSPDGKLLVTGNGAGLLYAWPLGPDGEPAQTGTQLSGRHTSTVTDLAFSPNGKMLASASADWSIHLWDYSSLGKQQQPIVIGDFDAWVMDVGFTTDSKSLVAVGADRTVRVRNVDMAALYEELARKVKRNLTQDEWDKYIGKDIPYEKTVSR